MNLNIDNRPCGGRVGAYDKCAASTYIVHIADAPYAVPSEIDRGMHPISGSMTLLYCDLIRQVYPLARC